ncbi:phosphoethanolamine transferase [Rickettsia endosymbiont of Halotydeus destructor]|uniref:phosphoethanolamine transferase n=1 Tax=Rickettsia endosymbiont of Halotydeus destructor TaxID=2996754 RepID=UPI003BAF2086
MFKTIQKHLDINLIKLSLILAFIYCLLFNSAVLIYKFDYYKASFFKAILELTKDFCYIYIFSFIIFFGFTVHRLILTIGTVFLFITSAIASYYLYFFKIKPTKEMIGSFFSTDLNEIYELVSIRLIIWLIFSLFACLYTLKNFSSTNTKSFVTKLLSAICLLIFVNSIISPPFKILNNYFPIQYLHNTYLNFAQNFSNSRLAKIEISREYEFVDNSAPLITGVLVIGESARFDHFGINGYERDTTPYLNSTSNIFSFKAKSASNLTYISVPSLLSRHPASNLENSKRETSFLSVLTKLGFNTNWIGTQTLMRNFANFDLGNIYNEVNFTIIPGGSALFALNDHDTKMLPFIEEILKRSEKQFLVIHTSGSHWNYDARYPKEFERFTPVCNAKAKTDSSSCNKSALINSYDNSILYTDFFLHNVIKLLEDKNSFFIYVSDHGESLGEGGYYGHGGPLLDEQITVPFIVWVSDKFKSAHPELVVSIESRLNSEISHDYVFHSLLDCLSIKSEIIDKDLSLCG